MIQVLSQGLSVGVQFFRVLLATYTICPSFWVPETELARKVPFNKKPILDPYLQRSGAAYTSCVIVICGVRTCLLQQQKNESVNQMSFTFFPTCSQK